MRQKNKDKKIAEHLFVKAKLSQKLIAEQLGLSANTVGRWSKEGNWKELKASQSITREELLKNAYQQLLAIDEQIESEGGVPTKSLSDSKGVIIKQIAMMGDNPIHVYVDVMDRYIAFLSRNAPKHVKETANYLSAFIDERVANEKN